MNKFRQHIPSFVEVNGVEEIEFETTKDLLDIGVVKQWMKPMKGNPFSHFAVRGNCLMAIYGDSSSWWCVGYVKNPGEVDLPKWDGGANNLA